MAGKVVSLINHKGGVAKTVSTLNIAAALMALGKRVLVVDLDSQGNLTADCGADPFELDAKWRTISQVMLNKGAREIRELIIKTPAGVHLVPAGLSLAQADSELIARPMGAESVLKRALEPILDDYDFIVIDCAPSLSKLTYNAFGASHGVLIPVQTERKAVMGFASLVEIIQAVREQLNPRLEILGVIPTLYKAAANEHKDALAALVDYARQLETNLFTPIPSATQISATTNDHIPAVCRKDLADKTKGYVEVANYLVEKYG